MDRIAEALDIVRRAKRLGDYDSNVVGMAGEVIAEQAFGMRKSSAGSQNVDGYWGDASARRSVQVKSWSSTRVARYGGAVFCTVRASKHADDLVVILIFCEEMAYEVLYSGPADRVGRLRDSGKERYIRLDDLAEGERLAQIQSRCVAQNAA